MIIFHLYPHYIILQIKRYEIYYYYYLLLRFLILLLGVKPLTSATEAHFRSLVIQGTCA